MGYSAENEDILTRLVRRVLGWLRSLLIAILAQGQVPRHIAFIMDGNRRFAEKNHVAKLQGHYAGFDTLEKILSWCLELGVKEVTVYAFSIENFKRTKDEVEGLMELTLNKLKLIMEENEMIDKLGIRVRALGDLSLLPEKTQAAIQKVVDYSKNNTNATLNVCLSYTARDEITRATRKIAETAARARGSERSGHLRMAREGDEDRVLRLVHGGLEARVEPPRGKQTMWGEEEGEEGKEEKEKGGKEIWGWEDEMWNAMDIDSAPDLLVRTSGEMRFSDFMLWQTAFSYVIFLSVLWPNFSLWHLVYIIFSYQANYKKMKERRKSYVKNFKNVPPTNLKGEHEA